MPVTYEWVTEELDGFGEDPEIIDTYASDTYAEALAKGIRVGGAFRVGLRRDRGDNVEGLLERHYAYVTGGKLQTTMESCDGAEDGPPTPKRFLKLF